VGAKALWQKTQIQKSRPGTYKALKQSLPFYKQCTIGELAMSKLRDLTKKPEFKLFIYDLKKSLEQTPDPTHNQLANLVAKSIGARSLEAYWGSIDKVQESPSRIIGYTYDDGARKNIKAMLSNLFTLVCSNKTELGFNDDGEGVSPNRAVSSHLFVADFHEARVKAEILGDDKFSVFQLTEFQTDFKEDFLLTPSGLSLKYNKGDIEDTAGYPHFYLTRKSYKQMVVSGETILSYWEWVANELNKFLIQKYRSFAGSSHKKYETKYKTTT
jgi:hypothetical protein